MPDWIWKISYHCYDPLGLKSYLPYREWSTTWQTKFSQVLVSHHDITSPPFTLFLVPNGTITYKPESKSSLSNPPCADHELTPSTAYAVYCIQWVMHHPKIDCCPRLQASLSSLSRPDCTQIYTLPQLQIDQWIESALQSRLTPKTLAQDQPPHCTSPVSLDYGHQVHLQTN